jgi:hypothetical protein
MPVLPKAAAETPWLFCSRAIPGCSGATRVGGGGVGDVLCA